MRHLRPGRGSTISALLLSGATALLLAACPNWNGDGGGDAASTLDGLKEAGAAQAGFANEAPYAFVKDETGELTGEAPSVARVILDRLGVSTLEGVLTEFGSLIPSLKAGRVDLIAAGMYVTPERCKQVIFSEPTYCIGEAFIVQEGNPHDLHSYQDVIDNPEVTLGLVSGTVEVGYAQKLGVPEEQIVKFPDMPSAAAGVAAGRADAFAGTQLTVKDLLTKMSDSPIERATPFTQPVIDGKPVRGCGAFAFRKSDKELRDAFNREIGKFIGTEAHLELVEPFGFGADTLPTGVTTEQLCSE